jgi:arginyl-tRNA synthetase
MGDRATNIALQTTKSAGRAPRELAESLRARLAADPPYVTSVEVAGPGFLNFRLDERWLHQVMRAALSEGEAGFARPRFGEGERVQVEFVSSNPKSPVHVGNGWWAFPA